MMKPIIFLALAALSTSGLAAQTSEEDAIVVEGQRSTNRVRDFVKQMTAQGYGGQLARFNTPVCPGFVGMLPDQNQLATARMRRVMAAVGLEVSKPGCRPNVVVLVVGDKAKAVRELAAARTDMFGQLTATEIDKLAAKPGAAVAWHVVERVGRDGVPLQTVKIDPFSEPVPMYRSSGMVSRIVNQTIPRFVGAVVLIEAKALNQATTTQVADYALMRALAQTNAERDQYADRSVLTLLNAVEPMTEAPQSLTWWDLAYLKALYSTSNETKASIQRGAMQRRMAEELEKAGDPSH